MKMEWPKDGPNKNGMAQDGPKKRRNNPKNLEYILNSTFIYCRGITIYQKSPVFELE